MSQPNTTSQKPNPPSTAEKNLSLCRYLPRNTPSMSDTATLTRLPAALRTASSTFLAGTSVGMNLFSPDFAAVPLGGARACSRRLGVGWSVDPGANRLVLRKPRGHILTRVRAAKLAQCPAMSDRSDESLRLRALSALHTAVLLFGFAGLFGKWLVLPPIMIVFGRTVVAAMALALLSRFAPRRGRALDRFEWRLAAGGAVLALHWVA